MSDRSAPSPLRTTPGGRCSSCRTSWRSTPTSRDGSSPGSSAASSPRPGSSGSSWGSRAGSTPALVAYLVAEAIGAEQAAVRADAVPNVVASLARRRRDDRRGPRLLERARRDHGDGRRVFRGDGVVGAGGESVRTPRPFGAATSWPGCACRCCTTGRWRSRGLVVGTGNKTESLIGYTTLFGDNACAFNPIGDLYKSQVRQLAAAIGVPKAVIAKAPSADLWPDQTDEGEGSFSYPLLDRILYWRIDRRRSHRRARGDGLRAAAGRARRAAGRDARSSSARCRRSPSSARARPAWTTCTRGGARARRAPERRAGRRRPIRPAGRCTSSRRRSATSATSRCGRSRCCAPCRSIAAEDTRISRRLLGALRDRDAADQLPRAQRAGARSPSCWRTCAAARTSRWSPTPGRRVVSDPGEDLVAAWAAEGGVGRADPGRVGGARRGRRRAASPGPRWGFEGFLPRSGRERQRAAGAHRRRRPGDGPVRGADAARGDAARPRRGVRRGPAGRGLPRADEAARADRARHARGARGGRRPTARSRRAARSCWSSPAARRRHRGGAAEPPMSHRAGARPGRRTGPRPARSRTDAARQVAAATGHAAPRPVSLD